MSTYTVWGDYGYISETAILETESLARAISTARQYLNEDDPEFDIIEVATHTENGEYVVFWSERPYPVFQMEDEFIDY